MIAPFIWPCCGMLLSISSVTGPLGGHFLPARAHRRLSHPSRISPRGIGLGLLRLSAHCCRLGRRMIASLFREVLNLWPRRPSNHPSACCARRHHVAAHGFWLYAGRICSCGVDRERKPAFGDRLPHRRPENHLAMEPCYTLRFSLPPSARKPTWQGTQPGRGKF